MPKKAGLWSLARSILEPSWSKDEMHLFQMLPYGYVVSDEVMSTRNGGLIGAAEITGINANTLDEDEFEFMAERFERVLKNTANDIAIVIHRISVPAPTPLAAPQGASFDTAVAQAWQQQNAQSVMKERKIILSAVLQKDKAHKAKEMFTSSSTTIEEEREDLIEQLDGFFTTLAGTLGDARVKRLRLSEGNWLGYYGMLLNGRFNPIIHTNECEPICFNLPQEDVVFGKKNIELDTLDDRERTVRIYSLKNYPQVSLPGIFDGLDLPVDIVTTQSYLPIPKPRIQEAIRVRRGQMKSAGDAAVSLEEDLGIFADGIAAGTLAAGKHHMTIAMFGTDEDLQRAEQCIIGEIQIAGGTLYRERMARKAAYFAQHPGNFALRPREEIISNASFADLVAFHMRPKGLPASKLPWKSSLAVFSTTQGERYDLSYHLPKTNNDEEDLPSGHTLIFGPNGSGKTVVAMFNAANAAARGTRIIAFDKDNAMEAPLRAMGAHYKRVIIGEPTGMNPFQTETGADGQSWLANWLYTLLSHNEKLSAEQSEEITKAALANATLPPDLQNFDTIVERFKAFDDGGDLYKRAIEWSKSGRLGWMFGEGAEDPFNSNSRHLAFDVSHILEDPLVRTAWLSYVLRRLEFMAREKIPTMIIIDEAWRLLDSPYFAKIIKEWFTTMRKLNCAVVMMTQTPEHILKSQASESILVNTSATLFFPSRTGSDAHFKQVGLKDGELASVRAHFGDRVMLFKKGGDSVWLDVDLSELGPLLRVLGGSDGKAFSNPNWRDNPDFWKEIA